MDFDFDSVDAARRDTSTAARDGRGKNAPQNPPYKGHDLDQNPWSILDTDWRQAKAVWGPKVH